MRERLFGGDSTRVDQSLNEGVVFGYLRNLAFADHVDARVADVGNGHQVAGKHDSRKGRAHALELGVFGDSAREFLVGLKQCFGYRRCGLIGVFVVFVSAGNTLSN